MSRWYFPLAMLMPVGLVAQPATSDRSIENWDGELFTQYCEAYLDDPASSEGSLCRGFMLGFVAGAMAVQKSVAPASDGESFTERAARTRVGSRLERLSLEALPWFCLGPATNLADIAASALADLDAESTPSSASEVAAALRRGLAQVLPCDAD